MRFLHYATEDCRGGAASAGYFIHQLLRNRGHDSRMLVKDRYTFDDPTVDVVPVSAWKYRALRLRQHIPCVRPRVYSARDMFNFDTETVLGEAGLCAVPPDDVDVVCLHWTTRLLTVRQIRRIHDHYRRPLIWLMNDQQPVTGGCHYSMGCDGYTRKCGCCPLLDSGRDDDRSREVWMRKKRLLSPLPIVFWCGSQGSSAKVRRSSLFGDHRRIDLPAPINDTVFRPLRRDTAREVLRVPQGKQVILLAATLVADERKGMKAALAALDHLRVILPAPAADRVHLLLAGHGVDKLVPSLSFEHTNIGFVKDQVTLALAYQAADVFVCPSLDDEGPMMVSEAMLCGTPVVMFQVGIAADLIRDGLTGYAARHGDAQDLARGIRLVLEERTPDAWRASTRARAVEVHHSGTVMSRFEAAVTSLVSTK